MHRLLLWSGLFYETKRREIHRSLWVLDLVRFLEKPDSTHMAFHTWPSCVPNCATEMWNQSEEHQNTRRNSQLVFCFVFVLVRFVLRNKGERERYNGLFGSGIRGRFMLCMEKENPALDSRGISYMARRASIVSGSFRKLPETMMRQKEEGKWPRIRWNDTHITMSDGLPMNQLRNIHVLLSLSITSPTFF